MLELKISFLFGMEDHNISKKPNRFDSCEHQTPKGACTRKENSKRDRRQDGSVPEKAELGLLEAGMTLRTEGGC